jgi:uncharacterized protein YndB with AHSA1/START domain
MGEQRVTTAERIVDAPAEAIFELIADPAAQPSWDGNENLREPGSDPQRVRAVDDVFVMTTTKGNVRENHVVEFEEGRRIAWLPAEPGKAPFGHLWRWELEPQSENSTLVRHTYDWTQLNDESRFERARWTTSERLMASIDRLAEAAESKA